MKDLRSTMPYHREEKGGGDELGILDSSDATLESQAPTIIIIAKTACWPVMMCSEEW